MTDRHPAPRRRQSKTVTNYESYCTKEKGVGQPYVTLLHTDKVAVNGKRDSL